MAKTLSRSSTASRIFYRFFSTSTSRSVSPSPLPSNLISHRSSPSSLFHLVGFIPAALTRFTPIRIRMDMSGGSESEYESEYEYESESDIREQPTAEMVALNGRDFKHWGIYMDEREKPGGENANKQQLIDCYVKTLAKIVGSEEEAKRKMYCVSCKGWFGFGCEIDHETAKKVYAELFVNGEVVPRPPERQKKIDDYGVNYNYNV